MFHILPLYTAIANIIWNACGRFCPFVFIWVYLNQTKTNIKCARVEGLLQFGINSSHLSQWVSSLFIWKPMGFWDPSDLCNFSSTPRKTCFFFLRGFFQGRLKITERENSPLPGGIPKKRPMVADNLTHGIPESTQRFWSHRDPITWQSSGWWFGVSWKSPPKCKVFI